MRSRHPVLKKTVSFLASPDLRRKWDNLQMPGDGRYQPEELRAFLGYDNWASWLIIVEWFWMQTLAEIGVMPAKDAKLLTKERLFRLIGLITTSMQDWEEERNTKHDILALLNLMRKYLPKALRKWLHFCATSYDIINTAYALQAVMTYETVFWPKLREVDEVWRRQIAEYADTLQAGRTHLQTALPVTVGFWLAGLHSRFVDCAKEALFRAWQIPGKFSGAVGTYASQKVFADSREAEKILLEKMLGLPVAKISTQITPPEGMARYYFELVLLSGSMANLGEDVRLLQSSQFGELVTASSSSSAMPHKTANPIAAENDAGMHVSVIAESTKVMTTLVSDLQRDLRWSNVMRSYSAAMVYCFQQIKTTGRILKSLEVNAGRCRQNFDVAGKLVVAELLHLALQKSGYSDTHHFVNKVIAPSAAKSGNNLLTEIEQYMENYPGADNSAYISQLKDHWQPAKGEVAHYLEHPEEYIGYAREIATEELDNKLEALA